MKYSVQFRIRWINSVRTSKLNRDPTARMPHRPQHWIYSTIFVSAVDPKLMQTRHNRKGVCARQQFVRLYSRKVAFLRQKNNKQTCSTQIPMCTMDDYGVCVLCVCCSLRSELISYLQWKIKISHERVFVLTLTLAGRPARLLPCLNTNRMFSSRSKKKKSEPSGWANMHDSEWFSCFLFVIITYERWTWTTERSVFNMCRYCMSFQREKDRKWNSK